MSRYSYSLPIIRLASMLCLTVAKVVLLLSNSILKGFIFAVSKAEEKTSPKDKRSDIQRYEYCGEFFTLKEIADLILMDQQEISSRLQSGETLTDIVDGPTGY